MHLFGKKARRSSLAQSCRSPRSDSFPISLWLTQSCALPQPPSQSFVSWMQSAPGADYDAVPFLATRHVCRAPAVCVRLAVAIIALNRASGSDRCDATVIKADGNAGVPRRARCTLPMARAS